MGIKDAQRLREPQGENTELKKLLADQMLKPKALGIALEGKLWARRGLAAKVKSAPSCCVRAVCRRLGNSLRLALH